MPICSRHGRRTAGASRSPRIGSRANLTTLAFGPYMLGAASIPQSGAISKCTTSTDGKTHQPTMVARWPIDLLHLRSRRHPEHLSHRRSANG